MHDKKHSFFPFFYRVFGVFCVPSSKLFFFFHFLFSILNDIHTTSCPKLRTNSNNQDAYVSVSAFIAFKKQTKTAYFSVTAFIFSSTLDP